MTDLRLPPPDRVPVLVVGAGPTGLTAAALLADLGVRALVVDRRGGTTDLSKALGLQARTLELFERLGVAAEAVRRGAPIAGAWMVRGGRIVARMPLADAGRGLSPYPYVLSLEQSETEALLHGALRERGGEVRWRTELLELTPDDRGARARLRGPGGERTVRADWVIGADGASSPVRKATGQRFVGGTYAQPFLLVDARFDGDVASEGVTLDLLRGGVIAFFPLAGEHRFRAIASLPEDAEPDALEPEELLATVLRRSSLDLRAGPPEWTSTYRLHHRRAERFRVGRILLAGDAAHVHSPVGGQGMNTGIGDAWNLAWKLARVVRGGAPEALLESYAAEREPFADALLSGTDRGFTVMASPGPWARLARRHFVPTLVAAVGGLPAARRRVFRLVSQIDIAYPGSDLAIGSAPRGAPGPGERAPDAPWPGGGRLFDRLAEVRHHLLLMPGSGAPGRSEVGAALGALGDEIGWLEPTVGGELATVYGAPRGGVRLIRPDGYLAVVAAGADALPALRRYARRITGADDADAGRPAPGADAAVA